MCFTSRASAHAPLPRALSAFEGSLALSLPGFGMVVGEGERFAYACDALLGLPLSNAAPALVRRPDGVLLLGTQAGLRAMTREGCPHALAELVDQPVYALAGAGSTVFAFAGDGVWRSLDAGEHWELRSPFASGAQVTGLVYAAGKLYASQGARLLVSSDEGASFVTTTAARPLTLLAVDRALWAVVRSDAAVGSRGYELWRADAGDAPWRSVLALDYFGGLGIDASGTVWVGDAGGGLLRSRDGETFSEHAALYPSCLQADGARVYTCNEDLPSQPALFVDGAPVMALDEVDALVSCDGAATRCAAAWVEWQRDVLLRPVFADGGVARADAGSAVVDAAVLDAGSPSLDAGPPAAAREHGCGLRAGQAPWWLLVALLAATRRRQLRGT